MSSQLLSLPLLQARRLAITRQRLAGPLSPAGPDALLDVVRDLGCLQLDPISVVERSHRLVLWSRLGPYERGHLDSLLWQERRLFEYWAHCASIVLTEDYPLFSPLMRAYPWSGRTRAWVQQNDRLRRYVLREIRRRGPLPARALEEAGLAPQAWVSTGWTSGRNISRMLDFLWIGGQIMVAGRDGLQKLWDLSARVLPEWTPRARLSPREVERRAVQKALRALGTATPRHIRYHFTRGRYPTLDRSLADLEREGLVVRVAVRDGKQDLPGPWYVHAADLPLVERLQADWQPRTTLLSPFDNLIADRARTRLLWDFDFTMEIYVPRHKRRFGYYVLPILHQDRLIGRLDPEMDRASGRLTLNAVYAEPGAPAGAGPAVAAAVADLAAFLGAREIFYNKKRVPAAWKRALLA